MSARDPVRVVLADDHRMLREGVRALLESNRLADGRQILVVGEAGNGAEALALCAQHTPQVAVLDVGLPDASGFEIARRLRASTPAPAVVILSMHSSLEHARRAESAGAVAYVVKGSGVADLAEAIGRAADGGRGPFPSVSGALGTLTEREREVLRAIANGQSNKEIAQALGISTHTVNTHRVHLMDKLDRHDVASLTRLAVELGMVD